MQIPVTERQPTVGILAVQGDFAAHREALQGQGVAVRLARRPQDLVGLGGLVLPGGESSAMLRLLDLQGLTGPLADLLATDPPVLATCAGLILLAREVVEPQQPSFGTLDVRVARNGYGRQIHSGTFPLVAAGSNGTVPPGATAVFIRAPRVLAVGGDVQVLATRDGDPVLLQRGNTLAACFHPELQPLHFVTRLFLERVRTWTSSRRLATA